MKFAIQIFGQFRSAQKVFEENIKNIKNITKNNLVDIYILSQRDDNYHNNENYIKYILRKYNLNLIFYKYVEDYDEIKINENISQNDYNNKLNIENKGYDHFVCKMWYRRYFLNQLFKKEKDIINANYDCVINCRLFDVNFITLKEFSFLKCNDDALYFSHDTFFMGSEEVINKLLDFGKNMSNNIIFENEIWNDDIFRNLFYSYDKCLHDVRASYCSEVQICHYIYRNFKNYLNLRFDFTKNQTIENSDAYLYVTIQR